MIMAQGWVGRAAGPAVAGLLALHFCAGCEEEQEVERVDYLAVLSQNQGNDDADLRSYRIGTDGLLKEKSVLAIGGAQFLTDLAVHPEAPYVYVADEDRKVLYSVSLGKNGSLHHTPGSPLDLGDLAPSPIAIASHGGLLIAAGQTPANTVRTFLIDPSDGDLVTTGESVAMGADSSGVAGDPDDSYAYVGDMSDNTVQAVEIGHEGELFPLGSRTVDAGGQAGLVQISPDGKLVFVAEIVGNQVAVFPIRSNGTLDSRSDIRATGASPSRMAVHPDGTFLYVANFGDASLSAFAIENDATLTELTGSPFIVEDSPSGVAITTKGDYLILSSFTENTLTVYALDQATGLLTTVADSEMGTGTNPLHAKIVRK